MGNFYSFPSLAANATADLCKNFHHQCHLNFWWQEINNSNIKVSNYIRNALYSLMDKLFIHSDRLLIDW